MHKARLFEKLTGKKVRCTACQRYCQISPGKVGFCLTRKNVDGQLYSLNYGITPGVQADAIEKKPLYHFHPGSKVLSIGSFGCNFRCKQCLNWWCSWGEPATSRLKKLSQSKKEAQDYLSPERLVELALVGGYPGIAFTYNEPVVWPEYVYEAARLAKDKGLYTVFVSNGSWTKQALDYYGRFIDAANIDFKGWGERIYARQGAFWGQLRENLKLALKKYQIHLELTTLVIPGINDRQEDFKKIASFIVKHLGPEIPWHLSRFSPERVADRAFASLKTTSIETLKKAYQIGKQAGLKNVYVWAPPDINEDSFFSLGDSRCPQCQKLVIKRLAWQPNLEGVKKTNNQGVCRYCGGRLYLVL